MDDDGSWKKEVKRIKDGIEIIELEMDEEHLVRYWDVDEEKEFDKGVVKGMEEGARKSLKEPEESKEMKPSEYLTVVMEKIKELEEVDLEVPLSSKQLLTLLTISEGLDITTPKDDIE